MKYDLEKIKESLTIEQVYDFCSDLGGEPKFSSDETFLIMRTICHNPIGVGSYKLYYYENSHLFKCFTECNETFDIFQLYIKVQAQQELTIELPAAVQYVAQFFNFAAETENFDTPQNSLQDWKILENYNKIEAQEIKEKKVELKVYDKKILNHLPFVRYKNWEKEGISPEIMRQCGIRYDPVSESIVIPHYDIDNNLIGIRTRTIIKEEEQFGKYRPAIFKDNMYNHPLSFALYGLNWNKDNIAAMKTAIVVEGEKSVMQAASYFGWQKNLCVAVCGSNLIQYQVDLLLNLGVTEIVIAFDKQWQKAGDQEYAQWITKLKDIQQKYGAKVAISFMIDRGGTALKYKNSPLDQGPEVFLKLFKERIRI